MADISIKLSSDYYEAYLTIEKNPNVDDGPKVKTADVIEQLKEKSVTFGIDYLAIDKALASDMPISNLLIAKGEPHKNGTDSVIEYKYNILNDNRPELLDDGTVNFKNIGYFTAVEAGSVLAVKTPATKAKPGTTVTGRTISGRDGRDKVFKIGRNVKISEDGLSLVSEIDGRLQHEGDKVSVYNFLEIRGDVGVETGNLDFVGSIVINGNITDGYEVRSTSDITVNGIIEGARVISGGDIIISRGVQGHDNAYIECKGDLVVNFVNAAELVVKGNIEANSIMSSIIKCDGYIELKGKQGQIVGGETVCKGNFDAKVIGSDLEIVTPIQLGLDFTILEELKGVSEELKQLKSEYDNIEKDIRALIGKIQINSSDLRLKLMLSKSTKRYDEIKLLIPNLEDRFTMLQEYVNNMMNSRLKSERIYPGTRVKIGNGNYYVKFTMDNTIIKREKGEIVVEGY